MKYFAYGSNMLSKWLCRRVPSAKVIGAASLRKHVLRWHKKSKDKSGKCDAFYTGEESDEILGVLYEICESEKPALDRAGGVGNGYAEAPVDVTCGTTLMNAFTYKAQPAATDASLTPYDWYKALVVAGAQEHQLPGPYVDQIEAQSSTFDNDEDRSSMALAVLAESGKVESK